MTVERAQASGGRRDAASFSGAERPPERGGAGSRPPPRELPEVHPRVEPAYDAALRAFALRAGRSGGPASAPTEEEDACHPDRAIPFDRFPRDRIPSGPLFAQRPLEMNAVAMSDVKQGGLNDCYFLASVAALANHERGRELVRGMIEPLGGLPERFKVKFAQATVEVTLEDVPVGHVHPGGGADEASLLDAARPELWPIVLERAYAKLHADGDALGYTAIGNCGDAYDAMKALTGSAMLARGPRGPGSGLAGVDLVSKLRAWTRAQQPVVVNTIARSVDAAALDVHGVSGSHSYTVLGVTTLADGRERIALRDPGGAELSIPMEIAQRVFTTAVSTSL